MKMGKRVNKCGSFTTKPIDSKKTAGVAGGANEKRGKRGTKGVDRRQDTQGVRHLGLKFRGLGGKTGATKDSRALEAKMGSMLTGRSMRLFSRWGGGGGPSEKKLK